MISTLESTSREEKEFLYSLKNELDNNLKESFELTNIFLESSALAQVSFASLKASPYVFFAKDLRINDLTHFFSSRAVYFESLLISIASMVHHFVITCCFTILVVGTIGLSDELKHNCKKHWIQLGCAVASGIIGAVGSLFPYYAVVMNAALIYGCAQFILKAYARDEHRRERSIIENAQKLFNQNYEFILQLFRGRVFLHRFKKEFEPALGTIKKRLNKVADIKEFKELVKDIWEGFPIGFVPKEDGK